MPDVFLSYSRDDQATARRFAQGFERAGLSVWWDQTLNAGEAYDEVTEKALEDAKAVAVLWSKKSVASRWVRAEATQADRSGTLVPAMIEDCKRPIMFELKQTADLSNWSGDTNDKEWLAYLASVRRLVEKGAPVAGTSQSPIVQPDHKRQISPAMIVGFAILLGIAVGAWMLNRARITPVAAPVAASTGTAATDVRAPVSIAVLPFVNMSSDPEQEYFSDGLSEELLNQLAQVPELRVIGRTSSFAFKGKNEDLRHIGEVLGVNHLLEGSVRKAGNRVLITAQLIRQSDASHIWSQTYERSLDDIFAIQEEIARTVASQLRLKLGAQTSNAAGTTNVAAYDEFLAGRAFLNSYEAGALADSSLHLERAVALDATYIPARLWLIDSYDRQALTPDSTSRARWIAKQDDAINQVVMLGPDAPEANMALSYRDSRKRDLQAMERHLKGALPLSGSLGLLARQNYNDFLSSTGQFAIAMPENDRLRQEDPLNIFLRTNLLLVYENAGEFDRADTEAQQLLQIPGGKSAALLGTAISRAQGQRDDAKVRDTLATYLVAYNSRGSLEAALAPLLENKTMARQRLRQIANEPRRANDLYTASGIAQWAAYFGDRELALKTLTEIVEPPYGFNRIAFMWFRPVFRDLRGTPEFKTQLRKLGLVDYWRATGSWGNFCKPVGKEDFECK